MADPNPDRQSSGFVETLADGAIGWTDPNVSGGARMLSAAALAYAVSPLDLLPEVAIPGIGLLDDAALLYLAGKVVQRSRRQ